MKSPTLTTVRHLGTPVETVKMGMRAEDLAHIATVLTDLYSRPKEAVLREYATNAYDANIEAGNNLPVEVTLPSSDSRNLVIRDSGIGLDADDIRDIYALYGRSTKRESNDVVGYLGLGCKSGLTYTDAFTVSSVKDGVRTTVQVAKDNDGVGTIRILDVTETNRASGTTVTIPVKPEDVVAFQTTAKEVYKYWVPGSILVNGEEPDRSFLDDAIWLDDDIAVMKNGTSKIVMGNVAYPWEPKCGTNVVADITIGLVDFAPSREALMFNAHTDETLDELRRYVAKMFPIRLEQQLRAAPDEWARWKLINAWRGTTIAGPAFKDFKGRLDLALPKGVSAWEYDRAAWKNKATRHERYVGFHTLNNATIITGFPYKSLSGVHKRRLEHTTGSTWLMLPEETETWVLEGHPRIRTWDSIVEETTETVAADPREKRKAVPTIYVGSGPHGQVRGESFTEDAHTPLLYWHAAMYNDFQWFRNRHPEANVIMLRTNQVDRFMRLHPWAKSAYEYNQATIERIKKDAPEEVRIKKHINHAITKIRDIDLTRVKDMELHRLIRIARADIPMFAEAARHGITWNEHPIHSKIAERYPLLYGGGSLPEADVLVYVNAKWDLLGLRNNNTTDIDDKETP